MKKYTIEINGNGAECYVFPLTNEQLTKFKIGGIVGDHMTMDDICQVLGVESILDSEFVYSGLYNDSDLYFIKVLDENSELVEDLTDNWYYEIIDDDDEYIAVHDEENNLIIEDTCKGEFFKFVLETEQDFDSSKLTPITTEVGESVYIITGLKYNGQVLEVTEYGDYWSKGFYFHLT